MPHHYGNSRAISDHTVYVPHSRDDISAFTLNQLRLVLDLVTPEGCKAWLYTEVVYLSKRQSPIPKQTGLNIE